VNGELRRSGRVVHGDLLDLDPDPLLDPKDEGLRCVAPAFGPDDLLELALELGSLQTRRTVAEMIGEARSPRRVELTVEVVLDLDQYVVAANL